MQALVARYNCMLQLQLQRRGALANQSNYELNFGTEAETDRRKKTVLPAPSQSAKTVFKFTEDLLVDL